MAKYSKLTREAIRALPPGGAIMEHGIEARRMKDGSVRWSVDAMIDGVRVHRVVGRDHDGVGRAEAESYLEQARTEARHDRLNLPKGRKVAMTVAAATGIYLAAMAATGGRNMKSKREHIRLHIDPYLGSMDLRKVSSFTLQKFRKHILDHGRSNAFVNRVGSTWNHLAKWLMDSGKTETVVQKMVHHKEQNERDYVIGADEERLLLTAADADCCPHVGAFIRIGLASALRHSEILCIRAGDIDWSRRRVRVRVKGGRTRDQALTESLCRYLQAYRETLPDPEGWLFPSTVTGSGHVNTLAVAFRRTVAAAGLDTTRVTPHTMRHTAATRFSDAVGGDIKTLQRYTGHLSLTAAMRYIHPAEARVDEALERIDNGQSPHKLPTAPQKEAEIVVLNARN